MNKPITPYPRADITGVVLAGGEGRRMGGVDKGLEPLAGQPMAAHALAALRGQCATVLINANRNLPAYAALGCPVVADSIGEFFGPLAGMSSAMAEVATPLTLFVPCDSPLLAADLGARLWAGKQAAGAEIAVARDAERYHPVFTLMDTALAASARAYLQSGERRIDRWFAQHHWVQVDCSAVADSFININSPQERSALEARLAAR